MAVTKISDSQAVQSVNLASEVVGTLPIANGGTGSTTLDRHIVPEASATSAATTLTLTNATTTYVFTGSSATTWTLPAVAGNTGFLLNVENRGSAAITLQRAGTDNIWWRSVVTSMTIAAGGSLQLVNDGTYWNALSLDLVNNSVGVLPIANGGTSVASNANVEYTGTTSISGVAVPTGIKGARVTIIAPGGGGGSGMRGLTSTIRAGGQGGGSGGRIFYFFIPAALLGTTYAVTIPAAGTGGAAQTVNSTNGNNGNPQANLACSFISGSYTLQALQAWGGGAGTATGSTALGFGGQGDSLSASGGNASSTGAAGAAGGNQFNGTPGGGGAGGGITSANAASNGGAGADAVTPNAMTGGAAGVVGGASPGSGPAAQAGSCGAGAGGGASSITAAAQAGAAATGYGAGGGGGGASLNGNNSGAGGAGGPGYVRIEWVYV